MTENLIISGIILIPAIFLVLSRFLELRAKINIRKAMTKKNTCKAMTKKNTCKAITKIKEKISGHTVFTRFQDLKNQKEAEAAGWQVVEGAKVKIREQKDFRMDWKKSGPCIIEEIKEIEEIEMWRYVDKKGAWVF